MRSARGHARPRWLIWLDGLSGRCEVCGQPLGAHGYYMQEEPDAISLPQAWTLCHECSEAVSRHIERLSLPVAQRLRIAVGLVASERVSPTILQARIPDAARERRIERHTVRLLIWVILILFVIHALAFIVVMVAVIPQ
jgi:hypothetical protein